MKKIAALPVGKDDFEDLITSKAYAVDKTLLVKDIVDSEYKINLITRPRRFGKTLALSMLKYFFEAPINNKDKRQLFNNTKIAGTRYLEDYQGKYPVIFFTLKEIKKDSWSKMREDLVRLISEECSRHSYILESDKLSLEQKQDLQALISRTADDSLLQNSLKLLSNCLEAYHNEKVIILIDEYDTPLTYAFVTTENNKVKALNIREDLKSKRLQIEHSKFTPEALSNELSIFTQQEQQFEAEYADKAKFYDEIRDFIRFWFSEALKSNTSLKFAVLTGITRLVNESIFSELNNISVSTVFDEDYTQFFGFTTDEMKKIYQDFELTSTEQQGMEEWYDGYNINNQHLFNPWSVINALAKNCNYRPYWTNTSSNPIVPVLFSGTSLDNRNAILAGIQALMNGEGYETDIKPHTGFQNLYKDADNFFCYLTNAGYLTMKESFDSRHCSLQIPNKEVFEVFPDAIQDQLQTDYAVNLSVVKEFIKAITTGNVYLLSEKINNFLQPSLSFYDTHEDFYHGVMLGLTFALAEKYYIYSNRESGYGRFDIMLTPKANNPKGVGIVIECKKYTPKRAYKGTTKEETIRKTLRKIAEKGLEQVEYKQYDFDLILKGISPIYKYTVVFYKKLAEVVLEA